MTIQLILLLILGVLLFLLFWKITKMVLKAITFAFLIILLVIGITGFFIYKDIKDFKDNIGEKPLLFVLTNQNRVLTAISIEKFEENNLFDTISKTTITQNKIEKLSSYYQNKDYEKMLENNYKIIFADIEFIENGLPDDFVIDDKSKIGKGLTKQKIIDILTVENPSDILDLNEDPNTIKNFFFILSFTAVIKEKGPLYLLKELRNGDIEFYKEPFSIKLIKNIPKT